MVLAEKQAHKDQWNRIEDPEIKPHSYSHLTFDKGAQNIHWRKKTVSSTDWENWLSTCKKLKLDLSQLVQKSVENGSKILM
jgi:hypothetical protein